MAKSKTLKIMPLGDSITYGWPIDGGYRPYFYDKLKEAGYDFDFVGSNTGFPPPLCSGVTDIEHEGHPGWKIRDISRWIDRWLEDYQPDVITMMIGTNNVWYQDEYLNAAAELDALIEAITNKLPDVHLFIASIIPFAPTDISNNEHACYLNAQMPEITSKYAAMGKKLYFVDMHAALDGSTNLTDHAHPNALGYKKMADTFFDAMQKVNDQLKVVHEPKNSFLYVSDINWIAENSGNGSPAARNKAMSGEDLDIAGIKYAKGIEICTYSDEDCTPSNIMIDIQGLGCKFFEADIGIDKSQGTLNGCVFFKVLVDDVVMVTSPCMPGNSQPYRMKTIIPTGSRTLTLRVLNVGNDNIKYLADWGNAILYTAPSCFISDMSWLMSNAADGLKPTRDDHIKNAQLWPALRMLQYIKGIETAVFNDNTSADVVIDIYQRGYTKFEVDVGIDDRVISTSTDIQFIVLADNHEIGSSSVLTGSSPIYHLTTDIPANTSKLILRAIHVGAAGDDNYAVWGNAMLSKC